ncbi:Holliday junction resolvase RecU [Enterococcus thailandicus]|uniref:Holliday junction resolvase RecU n=1 Tax=Enterococcus thailandicus TaxID=417368 RepID=UPI00288D22FD|nr:Holliday junction resolvase RecU [Enterococcus thailandicus]MDT2752919.1 Holliday junction resolvase RecU [Enterococcus thailandicus]MDT2774946.1 Holliday junction resolvase RecU [Enterococcus thailandicus]
MSYSKSWQSRANNNRGRQLEDLIVLACKYYRSKGIAEIDKTPEPFRTTKTNRDGTFSGRFTGHAQPDFQGTIKGGQSIVFEAKATSTDKLKQSVLSAEQANRLASHYYLGAICGICCSIGKTYAFVPWSAWEQMKEEYGRKYLTEKDLTAFAVRTPGYVDFLGGLADERIFSTSD